MNKLTVLLHNKPIGALTPLGGDRTIFNFTDEYREDENRATLSLSFKDKKKQLITEQNPTQTKLPPFFSNLLPEGPLREYLAKLANVKPTREYYLLAALGQDLPGAVTVISDTPQREDAIHTSLAAQRHTGELHFSLAGVQLKFSAFQEKGGGLSIPMSGMGGSWIVKLPSAHFPQVPENEFSMMSLARTLGMDVPEIRLIDTQTIHNLPPEMRSITGNSLAIKRFDRNKNGSSTHIEDFAQVFGVYPEEKYDKANIRNILRVIAEESDERNIIELIKRLTFNTLIGNADMHLKNWSLIYKNPIQPSLAPAYDFLSTIAYLPDDKAALNVSKSKRFDDFSKDELIHLAEKTLLPAKLVLDTAYEIVELFNQYWHREKTHLPLTKHVADTIDQHIQKIPLAQ